ncbi:hypothetical protein F4802DRAFT_489279 [Xylaria palmicola]|nr:hypothetical protein F4802DRAFT_489279 [Xylaria palmicola]
MAWIGELGVNIFVFVFMTRGSNARTVRIRQVDRFSQRRDLGEYILAALGLQGHHGQLDKRCAGLGIFDVSLYQLFFFRVFSPVSSSLIGRQDIDRPLSSPYLATSKENCRPNIWPGHSQGRHNGPVSKY